MDEIKDIYSRELYRPFVEYCAAHGYRTMRDLGCYDFRLLSRRPDFTPMLITRIKAVYTAYRKREAEKTEAAVPRRRTSQPISLVVETQMLLQLREYVANNRFRTVTLDELFQELDGQLKRTHIAKLLADAPWCRQVDRNTYFWNESGQTALQSEDVREDAAG